MRRLIPSGSSFETGIGWSRAVIGNGCIFPSGTTGLEYVTITITPVVTGEAEQRWRNTGRALAEAGNSRRVA